MTGPHSKSHIRPILLLLLSTAGLGLLVLVYNLTRPQYVVYAGSERKIVGGNYRNVAEVLDAAGVQVRPEDIVIPYPSEPVAPGEAIHVQMAQPVSIVTDNISRTVWTLQPNIAALLAESGVELGRTDQVFADGERLALDRLSRFPPPKVLEISHFVNVTIHDGNNQTTLRTNAQTVGDALNEANLDIFAADGIAPPLGSWLAPGLDIYIRRSIPLTIFVDDQVVQVRSHYTNPIDVLAETGIGLVGQDFTRPGPYAMLAPGETVEVIRVTEDFRTIDTPIPFETVWEGSSLLELDQRALLTRGITGLSRQRIRVRYENGVEVGQAPDGEWIASEPVSEVMGYGTQIVPRILETPEGAFEYWRIVRMRVTSYSASSSGKPPEHPSYGITASGVRAGTGIVAVDPSVVPFRSWVYVPGYGIAYAGDTGGGVKGRWIDLGYDEDEYVSWSGYVDVYYLAPIPPPDRINYLIPTWLP